VLGDGAVAVRWPAGLTLAANLSDAPVVGGFPPAAGRVLWTEGPAGEGGDFGPWAVRWSVEEGTRHA
jgi:hypothetical protein